MPRTMRVDETQIIEAGITSQITEQLRKELQGRGEVVVRQNIRYDPLGVEIQLKANHEEFEIRNISVGKKTPIVNGKPSIWKWGVTPLSGGIHHLILNSIVEIKVTELGRNYTRELPIYKEAITVQGNIIYSLQQFFVNHAFKAFIGITAVIFGTFAWWKALRPRKSTDIQQNPQ